jgi:hypothetical protein
MPNVAWPRCGLRNREAAVGAAVSIIIEASTITRPAKE